MPEACLTQENLKRRGLFLHKNAKEFRDYICITNAKGFMGLYSCKRYYFCDLDT